MAAKDRNLAQGQISRKSGKAKYLIKQTARERMFARYFCILS